MAWNHSTSVNHMIRVSPHMQEAVLFSDNVLVWVLACVSACLGQSLLVWVLVVGVLACECLLV